MSVLELIRGKIAVKRQQQKSEQRVASGAYQKAVLDSVSGADVDPDEIMATITAAGYSFDDFERHVAVEQERIRLREVAATRLACERQIREVEAQVEEFRKEVERTNEAFRLRSLELGRQRELARAQHSALTRAEAELAKLPPIGEPTTGKAPYRANGEFLID